VAESVKVVRTVRDLRKVTAKWRKAGKTVALVPTMGALHAGHISLVRIAKKKADKAVVSIFVNPTQFAPHEDLARYPRDEAGDLEKLAKVGADLVWSPSVEEMYPEGTSTRIEAGSAAADLEGAFRPHHFGGVATVCCKLFNQVTPDFAIFGEKDYQQLMVVTRMARDLHLPVRVVGIPTVREPDGLALSSRNAYLSGDERKVAPTLHRVLAECAGKIAAGSTVAPTLAGGRKLIEQAGFALDYLEARHAETLAPLASAGGRPMRLLVAARLGKTRLIDNIGV
jgi:pantoate--beta-alanine ligase